MNLQKQLRCVYLHAFFSTLRFTDAVWVALLAARGFSLAEIGLAEGVFHLTSLLCEVPSGMAADLLGRRRTLIFGGVLGVFSALAMASAPGLGLICTAMALKALGYNMLSGTAEALIYDSLKMAGREKDYIKVDANASICMKIATALGSLASLLAGVLRYAGYYLADAVSALLSALAAAQLEEPIVTDEQAARERHTLRELPARLRVHILDSADCLRGSAKAAAATTNTKTTPGNIFASGLSGMVSRHVQQSAASSISWANRRQHYRRQHRRSAEELFYRYQRHGRYTDSCHQRKYLYCESAATLSAATL